MNMTSASPAENAGSRVLVWDAAVRVFHWTLVLCFAGAWLTAESERWRLVHVTLGYTAGALVLFRIGWGFVGSFHARFANFVRGPAAVRRYVASILGGRPEHHTGHNPAGALAILAILALMLAVVATGWSTYNEIGGEWLEDLHEGVATALLALVGVHVAAVIASSLAHRENLVAAMVTGRKQGGARDAIRSPRRIAASLLVAAVLGFWSLQWLDSRAAAPAGASPPAHAKHSAHSDDDDD
jgi:cytochrome b